MYIQVLKVLAAFVISKVANYTRNADVVRNAHHLEIRGGRKTGEQMQQTIFGANRTERPIAPAGKVLVEGIGYFDGDDKAVLEKAFFK